MGDRYHRSARVNLRRASREAHRRLRAAMLAYLGGKCAWVGCGFSDPRALQLDHINGSGSKEARRLGQWGMYKKVLSGTPGYQLLCANHNWIKKYDNHETNLIKES